MSYSKIYKIAVAAVLGVFLFCVLIYASKTKFGMEALVYSESYYTEEASYTQEIDDIYNIDISWLAGDVTVSTYSGDVIKVVESTSSDLSSNEKLLAEIQDETYQIEWSMDYNAFDSDFPSYTKSLEVYIPEDMEIEQLTVNGRSSDVSVNDIFAEYVKIQATSGEITCDNIITENLVISQVEGNAVVNDCYAYELKVSTLSGDMEIKNSTGLSTDLDTTSGEITMEDYFQELTVMSVTGDVNLITKMNFTSIDINSVSGNINLSVPTNTSATMEYETYDGEISTFMTEVDEYTYTAGNATSTSVSTIVIATTTAQTTMTEGSSSVVPTDEYDKIIEDKEDAEQALADALAEAEASEETDEDSEE